MEKAEERVTSLADVLYVMFRAWRRMLLWGLVLLVLLGGLKLCVGFRKKAAYDAAAAAFVPTEAEPAFTAENPGSPVKSSVVFGVAGFAVGVLLSGICSFVQLVCSGTVQDVSALLPMGPVIARLPEVGKNRRGKKLDRLVAKCFGIGLKCSELKERVEALSQNVAGMMQRPGDGSSLLVLLGDVREKELNQLAMMFAEAAGGAFRVLPGGDVTANAGASKLLRKADTAVVVAHRSISRIDTVKANVLQAEKVGVKVLGIVLTNDWAIPD